MTELAALVVDHVLPLTRTRPWVLSLPFELRAPVAWHHDLALAVQRVVVPKNQRKLLEHLCCCLTRHAFSHNRITLTGRVRIQLKTPWQDRTTHVILEPLAFCARLAALIPRPRKNLLGYHGALAPNARLRARVVAVGHAKDDTAPTRIKPQSPHRAWADPMRRTFAIDVTVRPTCSGRIRLMAILLNPRAAVAILRSLGLPHERVTPAPSRGPRDEPLCNEQDFQVA